MKKILLGTRGSALALAQTEIVKAALASVSADTVVAHRVISTVGDQRLDVKLNEPGSLDKGLFTKELEEELLRGTIDAAVHSLKDLPTTLPPGLVLTAVLPRANTADILIGKSPMGLHGIPPRGIVATSSERRKRYLQWIRPDLEIIAIRGNVPTRLRKLTENEDWGGIVLARAGLERLGYEVESGHIEAEDITFFATALEKMRPAPGQGAIALETREDDRQTREILNAINHESTYVCIRAERALLQRMGGGCHMPLGVETRMEGGTLTLEADFFDTPDSAPRTATAVGPAIDPEGVAETLYHDLIA